MDILEVFLSGSAEPFRAEVIIHRSENFNDAKVAIGGKPIEAVMGHFAVELDQQGVRRIEDHGQIRITDRRVLD